MTVPSQRTIFSTLFSRSVRKIASSAVIVLGGVLPRGFSVSVGPISLSSRTSLTLMSKVGPLNWRWVLSIPYAISSTASTITRRTPSRPQETATSYRTTVPRLSRNDRTSVGHKMTIGDSPSDLIATTSFEPAIRE